MLHLPAIELTWISASVGGSRGAHLIWKCHLLNFTFRAAPLTDKWMFDLMERVGLFHQTINVKRRTNFHRLFTPTMLVNHDSMNHEGLVAAQTVGSFLVGLFFMASCQKHPTLFLYLNAYFSFLCLCVYLHFSLHFKEVTGKKKNGWHKSRSCSSHDIG